MATISDLPACRPDLVELFTPYQERNDSQINRFKYLTFEPYCEGVDVAIVPARFIDGTSAGVAGFVARTSPKRASKQKECCVWVGLLRVKVAIAANEKTEHVYHVGTDGPLFASWAAAGEAARAWRFPMPFSKQKSLPHVL